MQFDQLKRREFVTLLGGGAALWPLTARAQQPGKIYKVGLLGGAGPVASTDERSKAMLAGLAARGFVEGRNLLVEERWSEGRAERLPTLVDELKAANVNVIVTFGYPSSLAAKSSGLPVVIAGAGDPVATGLVEGLARPGGNVTGVTEISTELSAKRLEILKDACAAPATGRHAVERSGPRNDLALPVGRECGPHSGIQSADLGRSRAG